MKQCEEKKVYILWEQGHTYVPEPNVIIGIYSTEKAAIEDLRRMDTVGYHDGRKTTCFITTHAVMDGEKEERS